VKWSQSLSLDYEGPIECRCGRLVLRIPYEFFRPAHNTTSHSHHISLPRPRLDILRLKAPPHQLPLAHHGSPTPPVEVHVPVPHEDVARHSPIAVHCYKPQCLSGRWEHVQPPGSCPPLPCHGKSACRSERSQWQLRSCRSLRRCKGLPHPRQPCQTAHFAPQRSSSCRI
jgi:hypothetical protein